LAVGVFSTFAQAASVQAAAPFAVTRQTHDERAEWIALDGRRVAYGSGSDASLMHAGDGLIEARLQLGAPIRDAFLYSEWLYINAQGGGLAVVDLRRPRAGAVPLTIDVPFAAAVRTTRIGEHLAVLEDGFGLRLFELPPPAGHGMHAGPHRDAHEVRPAGTLAIAGTFTAVGSSGVWLLVATEGGRLLVIDAHRVEAPRLERTIDLGADIVAVGGSGARVYALREDGLTVVDLAGDDETLVRGVYPEIRGRAIAIAGRELHVADPGITTLTDHTAGAVLHFVNVSNFVFTPEDITINPGDSVRWTNTSGSHNVISCDGVSDPSQCGGAVAAEGLFTSGGAAFGAWTYTKLFTVVGNNPYYCVVHVSGNMIGSVTVEAPVIAPPGTPDGSLGTDPLLVAKAPLVGSPNRLIVTWDATTCPEAAGYELLFGEDVDLPATLGGTYGLLGQICSIGTSGNLAWTAPPTPAPGAFHWYLVVATDGVSAEGSWGQNSGPNERTGPGPGGSSGTCRSAKDLSNACGQ
jgi:plastocyanin